MPIKVKTKPKVTKAIIRPRKAGPEIAGSDAGIPSVEQIMLWAMKLRKPQLARLVKDLDQVIELRWELEREAVAKRIAAKGITEADIDEYIVRRRRENRR